MIAVIYKMESQGLLDAETRGWVNRVRELAYEVEDRVDFHGTRVNISGGGSAALSSKILRCLRLVRYMLPLRRVVISEFRELKERVVQLRELWERYSLDPLTFPCVPQPHEPVEPPLTTSFVDDGRLVGFDGSMEEVKKMVTGAGGKAAELKIVSVVGMAGSGKTTLTTAVYRQLRQQNWFQIHAFVSLGQKADMLKQALQDMLSQLSDGHGEGLCCSRAILTNHLDAQRNIGEQEVKKIALFITIFRNFL